MRCVQNYVIPAVNAFVNCVNTGDCPMWEQLLDSALRYLQELALFDRPVDVFFNQLGAPLQIMYQKWNSECALLQDCKLKGDCVDSILSLARQIELLGVSPMPPIADICGGYFQTDLVAVAIVPETATLKYLATQQFTVRSFTIDSDNAPLPAGAVVSWISENSTVATVDPATGMVTATGVGTTNIVVSVAQCENVFISSAQVTVIPATYDGSIFASGSVVSVDGSEWAISEQYYADAQLTGGEDLLTLVGTVSWSISSCASPMGCVPYGILPVSHSISLGAGLGGGTSWCWDQACLTHSVFGSASPLSFFGTWITVWSGYSVGSYSGDFSLAGYGGISLSGGLTSSAKNPGDAKVSGMTPFGYMP